MLDPVEGGTVIWVVGDEVQFVNKMPRQPLARMLAKLGAFGAPINWILTELAKGSNNDIKAARQVVRNLMDQAAEAEMVEGYSIVQRLSENFDVRR